jgi:hypothetical protein
LIPSKENLADEPSRQLNKSDATLHTGIWHKIQEQFGGGTGNTIDLMSVDSNTMKDYNGKILKHFTPYPTPLSAGVNLFSQTVDRRENCYVVPGFCAKCRYAELHPTYLTVLMVHQLDFP